MKQTFTQLTFACSLLFATPLFSQNVSQNFETQAEINALNSHCWTFNGVTYTNNNKIEGDGSIVSQLGVTSEIITPNLSIPTNNLQIRFSYKRVEHDNGAKKLQIFLFDGIEETKIEELSIGSDAVNYNETFSGPRVNGVKKIIFRTSDNISVVIDNLRINAPYTYPGGCVIQAIVLPLKLLSFQGALNNSQSQLQWTVAENETGRYFEVEKSFDGRSYTTAGVVMVTQKSGSETYSYKEGVQNATFYRLKMVSEDGSVSYSKIILIKAQEEASATIALLQNPVRQTLSFSFTSSASTSNEIAVYNLAGAKVQAQKLMAQKGNNSISLKLNNNLTAGTYILEVKNNSERTTTKFIKQ